MIGLLLVRPRPHQFHPSRHPDKCRRCSITYKVVGQIQDASNSSMYRSPTKSASDDLQTKQNFQGRLYTPHRVRLLFVALEFLKGHLQAGTKAAQKSFTAPNINHTVRLS